MEVKISSETTEHLLGVSAPCPIRQ